MTERAAVAKASRRMRSRKISNGGQARATWRRIDSAPMKPATHSFYTDAVRRVIEHVVSHLGEALALETLAEQACLSPFHFHRVFRGMVGETPVELVRRPGLGRAAGGAAARARAAAATRACRVAAAADRRARHGDRLRRGLRDA